MRDLARKITKHCFYDESDNPRLDGIERLLENEMKPEINMTVIVQKFSDKRDKVVCGSYSKDQKEWAEKRVKELMDARTEKCWYEPVEVELK